MVLSIRCRGEERIWIKLEGWLATKVQVRAFPLGRSIIVFVNDGGSFLGRHINNCTIFVYNSDLYQD